MKSIIIIGDGMSDHPVERLGGKTPLMAARKPNIDRIAREGRLGLFETIPPGMPKGSEVANLTVLGYDPRVDYHGRAVLEAASIGVPLADDDVALRCNLISLTGEETIANHSAGHIETEEAKEIIATLEAELGSRHGSRPVSFHTGVSYRHLLVLHGRWATPDVTCAPPHDHVGEPVAALMPHAALPAGEAAAERLVELYRAARPILAAHPVNARRKAAGHGAADSIWPWSPGRRPRMRTIAERFGRRGAVISAVDLLFGLGAYAGMDVIHVEGATGLWDTNYEGKARAALDALAEYDFVYLHVEATDEAGHSKDLDLKIRCIEMLDARVVGPILEGLAERGIAARVAILPDHPTPVATGNHADDPVPVAVCGPGIAADAATRFDEAEAARGSLGLLRGDAFIRLALDVAP